MGWTPSQGLGRAGAGACPTSFDNGWESAWIPGGGTPSAKVQTGIEQNPTAPLCQGTSPDLAAKVTLEVLHSSFPREFRICLHLTHAPGVPAPGNLPNPLWNKAAGQQVTQPQPLQRESNS